jgi:DNA repair protein RecO (recombination protein O)
LTQDYGLIAGFVRGGRSRTMRPVLQPGNVVKADLRARVEGQLPAMTVDALKSRALLMGEPLAAEAIAWVCALAAAVLPERHAYPDIHSGLDGVLSAIEAAPSARRWVPGLIAYEGLILSALGYGGRLPETLDMSGKQLAEHIFSDHRVDMMAARSRLIDRLNRVGRE